MQKRALWKHCLLTCVVSGLTCVVLSNDARAYYAAVPQSQQLTRPTTLAEIYRIEELAESQKDEAIKQLNALRSRFDAQTPLSDQREALSVLIQIYLDNDQRDLARKYITELQGFGIQNHDKWATASALVYEASLYNKNGDFPDAKIRIVQALALATEVNQKSLTSRANIVASFVYKSLGEFQLALQHQLIAMDNLEEGSRHADLARANAMNSISLLYLALKDPQSGLDYNEKATTLARAMGSQTLMGMLALNRGYAYADLDRLPEAIKSYEESLVIAKKFDHKEEEALALNNLSDAAFRMENYKLCIKYGKATLDLSEQLNDNSLRASAYVNLGLCHMGAGEVPIGVSEVNHGMDYLRKANAKPDIEQVLGQFAQAYEKAGMYHEAYKTILEQLNLSTELFRADRDRAVSELKAKYDASQREKQIEVLQQKNQVQTVELKNKGLQRIIATLATLIAVAVAVTIFMLYRKVRKTNQNLEEANVKLAHQSTRDPLTGLLNRRAFHDTMKYRTELRERRSSENQNPPHALVILDIDHFKNINDTYGHAAGDAVLVEISNRLTHVMRDKDMLMRWGGEEFLVFLNQIPVEKIPQVVERILISVGARPIGFEQKVIPVTVSAGYISLPVGTESEIDPSWEKMLNLADSALYMAKTRGRNRAIGIETVNVMPSEFDELLQGNLENSITEGKVTIQQLAGPVQNEILTTF